jgi:hypothetical protein
VIITPAVSDEETARRFPGHRVIKPYLRITPHPPPKPRPGHGIFMRDGGICGPLRHMGC